MKNYLRIALALLFLLSVLPAESFVAAVPADSIYTAEVILTGGSGRASVASPARLIVRDGKMTAEIVWSSPNYDRMRMGGTEYSPVNTEGNTVFEIAVPALDTDIEVSAETLAMSEPHWIDYTLRFDAASLTPISDDGLSTAKGGIAAAAVAVLLAGGAVCLKKRAKSQNAAK